MSEMFDSDAWTIEGLEDLDIVFEEPVIISSRKEARELQGSINGETLSAEDRTAAVALLDATITNLIDTKGRVSGWVRYIDKHTGEVKDILVNNQSMIFNGYSLMPVNPVLVTDYDDGYEGELRYQVFISAQAIDLDEVGADVYVSCHATLDSVVEFDDTSFDKAEAWLRNYYPDAMDELDQLIYEDYGTDESNTIISLGGYKLPAARFDDENDVRRYFDIYLKNILVMDKEVPYICSLEGTVYIQGDDGRYDGGSIDMEGSYALFKFIEPALPFIINSHECGEDMIYLLMQYIPENYSEEGMMMYVPVSSITDMRSVRHSYHTA